MFSNVNASDAFLHPVLLKWEDFGVTEFLVVTLEAAAENILHHVIVRLERVISITAVNIARVRVSCLGWNCLLRVWLFIHGTFYVVNLD